MQPFSSVLRCAALAGSLILIAGCSEYLDRRDTIALSSGNAVATDAITQMVDPWPRESADKNIAFNGDRMESAFVRYRTGKVITPAGIGTGTTYQTPPLPPTPSNSTPVGPTVTQQPK